MVALYRLWKICESIYPLSMLSFHSLAGAEIHWLCAILVSYFHRFHAMTTVYFLCNLKTGCEVPNVSWCLWTVHWRTSTEAVASSNEIQRSWGQESWRSCGKVKIPMLSLQTNKLLTFRNWMVRQSVFRLTDQSVGCQSTGPSLSQSVWESLSHTVTQAFSLLGSSSVILLVNQSVW